MLLTFSVGEDPLSLVATRCREGHSLHCIRIPIQVHPQKEGILPGATPCPHPYLESSPDHLSPVNPVLLLKVAVQPPLLIYDKSVNFRFVNAFPDVAFALVFKVKVDFIGSVVIDCREFSQEDVGFCACADLEDHTVPLLHISPDFPVGMASGSVQPQSSS